MKLHVWCELLDKLFNTIWQIYGQKHSLHSWLCFFFQRFLMPCSPHVPVAALRDLDLDLWQGTADYFVLPALWLPLVTRSRLRHPLASMKASQPSDKYGFHYCVYSDYFFNFLRVCQVTDMHINHPGLLFFMLTVMVSEREDYRLNWISWSSRNFRQRSWLHCGSYWLGEASRVALQRQRSDYTN